MTLLKKFSLLFLVVFGAGTLLAQDDDFVFHSDLARDWYQGWGVFRVDFYYC